MMVCGQPWRARRDITKADVKEARALGSPCSNNAEIISTLEDFYGPNYFKPVGRTRRFDRSRDAIIGDLWAEGSSLAQVARDNGLDARLLGLAIHGESLDRYHWAIAKALGVPVHVLWPSLYQSRTSQARGGAAA